MYPRQIRNRRKHGILEAKVVKATKAAAKKAGFEHRKVKYDGRNGAPDDWFFGFDGLIIIIEFKRPGKEPEAHQELEIKRFKKRGFKVYVIDNEEDGKALFEGLMQW